MAPCRSMGRLLMLAVLFLENSKPAGPRDFFRSGSWRAMRELNAGTLQPRPLPTNLGTGARQKGAPVGTESSDLTKKTRPHWPCHPADLRGPKSPSRGPVCRYVAPAGSDSNPGTSTAPFLTIQKAADVVNPGDVVIVADGIYGTSPAPREGSKLINMTRGGNASAWVRFVSEHKWRAVVDGQHNTTAEAWVFAANYIRVEGFEIRGFSDDAFQNDSGGNFIAVVGNHIHDIGRYCTDTPIGRDGIFISRDNVTIEQNVIHDIGRYAPGEQGCSPATAYYKNHDHGIYISAASNVIIRNNVFYNCSHGWSIHVDNAAKRASKLLYILNNTFAFANPWRTGQIIIAAPVANAWIENNIFYRPESAGIYFDPASRDETVTIAHNISTKALVQALDPETGRISNDFPGVTFSGNQENSDPRFVNPSNFDFHLAKGSPATGTGLPVRQVTNDVDGARRSGRSYDLGAYQSGP